MATNTFSTDALSDDEMDIVGDSLGHDFKDILHQMKTMGKKLDMLISTVSKYQEVGKVHMQNKYNNSNLTKCFLIHLHVYSPQVNGPPNYVNITDEDYADTKFVTVS